MPERTIRVFEMNDCDWMAGESLESVTKEYRDAYGGDEWEDGEPHALTDKEMDETRFSLTNDDDKPIGTCSFRERLDKLIAEGQTFPCFFASTEF